MFSLDEALAEWRDSLSQKEAFRNEDTAELEAHLREQMTQFGDAGLTEEEAFRVAAFRMGDTGRLACEFGKVNGDLVWQRRFMWMAVGMLGYVFCVSLGDTARWLGVLVSAYPLRLEWAIDVSGIVAQAVVWLGTIWFCVRLASGRMPGKDWLARRWQRRRACATDLTLAVVGILAVKLAARSFLVCSTWLLSPEQLGRAALTTGIAGLAWSVVLPVILMVMFYRLRNRREGQLREE
jgi:hypothetical protein